MGDVTPTRHRDPSRGLLSRLPAEAPMIGVLTVAAVGLLRVGTANWREGSVLLGGSRVSVVPDAAGTLSVDPLQAFDAAAAR